MSFNHKMGEFSHEIMLKTVNFIVKLQTINKNKYITVYMMIYVVLGHQKNI